jgi:Ni/Fe-hydrogenase subunit HybB-like protein
MHPFWYTPALPFFFFISAIAVGLSMTIFESTISSRAFGRGLERSVICELSGALYVVVWVMALLRFEDYFHRGQLGNILHPSYEAYFLWVELILAFVIPLTLLSFKKVRTNPDLSYLAALSAILGFVTNRLNVAMTSMETWVGHHYLPKWTELSITLMICAMGFFIFTMCVKFLPIYEEDAHHEPLVEELAEPSTPTHQPTLVH